MARKDVKREALKEKRGELLKSLRRSSKQLEIAGEELKKADQLEVESVDKISHECRTLLNVVIGFTELMLDEVMGKINEEQRNSLTEISNSAQRLIKLNNIRAEQPARETEKKK
jgi:signal transduction histidine kinase